ncbi:MAG: ParB N-terminal domain-containing protein [Clostridiales bacterium]|nr:ParB N-terminal domain-containing protein [Clostridiales bacterium]
MTENIFVMANDIEIPVFCAFDKLVEIDDLKPNPKNPNQHPQEQIALLAHIIQEQGWRAPVTVSTLSGFVVRGHGRLMAAKLAGCEKVPVD